MYSWIWGLDAYYFRLGFGDAYQKALEICEAENRVFVHAFNDRDVVSGNQYWE